MPSSTTAAQATTAPGAPTAATAPSPAPPQPTTPPRASAVTLRLRAANLAFDQKVVRASAGAAITAIMQNDDTGVDHNLSFSIPGLGHGDTCAGPCSRTQTFTAPSAGSYFFLCTIHDMTGTLIVDP